MCIRDRVQSFNSRWLPINSNDYRAIDQVIHTAYEAALERAGGAKSPDSVKTMILDNLSFWQRVGQRLNTTLAIEEHGCRRREMAKSGRFGAPERFKDQVSAAKHDFFDRCGVAPIVEPTVPTLVDSTRAERLAELIVVMDDVETWLRSGTYRGAVIATQNPPIHSRSNPTAEKQLCRAAVDTALSEAATALVHGPSLTIQFGLEAYLVGDTCHSSCSNCGDRLEVLQTELFSCMATVCVFCGGRFCIACGNEAMKATEQQRCTACKGADETAKKKKKKSAKRSA